MAARVIAQNVGAFHQTPEGQQFQDQARHAWRLNTLKEPEAIADYLARNKNLLPIIDIAKNNATVLCGISLRNERTTQRLFFKHATNPALGMQITLSHPHTGPITAATDMKPDENGQRPDPVFTPMIQAVLEHMAFEQQISKLAGDTKLSLSTAREMTNVPWMPFIARQIVRQWKLRIKNVAKISSNPKPSEEACTLDIVEVYTRGVVWRTHLKNGKYDGSSILSQMNQRKLDLFTNGNLAREAQTTIIELLNDCTNTLNIAGTEIVQRKPWALDFLHQIHHSLGDFKLSVPKEKDPNNPDAIYFELRSASQKTGYTVNRNGSAQVNTAGYPLVVRSQIEAVSKIIPRFYPLAQSYP